MNKEYKLRKHLFPKLLLFSFLTVSFHALGQVVFEQGYFIDNNNKKTECLIKNYEWRNSPTEIEYKLLESVESKTAGIADVKEFKVSNLKYCRFTLLVDQSSTSHSNLSKEKEPIFLKETLFLRVIIEGKSSLYFSGKDQRYFYGLDSSDVKQLIHKEYIFENRVLVNNTYKSQLWEDLKCSCITVTDIKDVAYTKKILVKIFETYNSCVASAYINYIKNERKFDFNLSIRPGLRLAQLWIKNSINQSQFVEYDMKASFSFGIEAEIVFPFNKNKWAFIFEPTYQSYQAEDPREYYSNTVDYSSIEFPVGLKYIMFLKKKSKLFLTAAVVLIDIPIHSTIGTLDISSSHNFNFGFGYIYNNKFSAEFRYGTKRSLLNDYALYTSNYQSFSLIIGYNIF